MDPARILTSELAISTPMVPTTIRWIHCLAWVTERESTEVIFQRKARTNARAPIEPTRAWPIAVQVVIRLTTGAMAGSTPDWAARKLSIYGTSGVVGAASLGRSLPARE